MSPSQNPVRGARVKPGSILLASLLFGGAAAFTPLQRQQHQLRNRRAPSFDVPPRPSLAERGGAAAKLKQSTNAYLDQGASDVSGASDVLKPVLSTTAFVAIDIFFKKLFQKLSIRKFPSSLAGCGFLLASMLALNAFGKEEGDDSFLYGALKPGATALTRWLPVFFVPSLVVLPLAPSLGDGLEIAKVATIIVGGFFVSLLATAWSIVGARRLFYGEDSPPEATNAAVEQTPAAPKKKAFSDETFFAMTAATLISCLLFPFKIQTLQSLFFLFLTLTTFVLGTRFPPQTTKLVHPVVTCTGVTLLVTKLLSFLPFTPSFVSLLQIYKTGKSPSLFSGGGAGDVLLFLLGPAVLSLSVQMYDNKKLIARNWREISVGLSAGSATGLLGTALMVRFAKLASGATRLALLSRNITSPLAIAIANLSGAPPSLAVALTVITGLLGANFARSILDSCGVTDAATRGLSVGTASHGLGTAAMTPEKEAFPFAAVGMALGGSLSTVLMSMDVVRNFLMRVALG